MILPDNVVGYLDFGITGVLSRYSRRHLVAMTLAYARADLDGMAEAFFRVSSFAPNADRGAFRRGLEQIGESWFSGRRDERRLAHELHPRHARHAASLAADRGVAEARRHQVHPLGDRHRRPDHALRARVSTSGPHLQRVCEQQIGGEADGGGGVRLRPAGLGRRRLAARCRRAGPAAHPARPHRPRELTLDAEIAGPWPPAATLPPALLAVLFALLAERAAAAGLGLNPFTALAVLAVLAIVRHPAGRRPAGAG